MGYELHVVRDKDWLQSAKKPITKNDVDALIATDKELSWSKHDYLDSKEPTGRVVRYWMIEWRGDACFLWLRSEIIAKNPTEPQIRKLVQIAKKLKAQVIGDDGEMYSLRRNLFGAQKVRSS